MKQKLSLALAVAVLAAIAAYGADTRDVALLFKTKGKVEIFRLSQKKWFSGKRGLRLNSGDKVRTGDESLAAVVFTDDKSLMRIRSRSDVTIRGEREKKSITKRVFLQIGEVFVKIKKQRGIFRLETPTGVAAVKGTQFYGIVDEQGTTFIVAIEGVVELINKYGSVLVSAGETGRSDGKSAPTKEKTDPSKRPTWGEEEEGEEFGDLEIEFRTPEGTSKRLKIRTKKKEE
jgi:hypothetical protein